MNNFCAYNTSYMQEIYLELNNRIYGLYRIFFCDYKFLI
uniref:Uncharacterized protein n=1 Tax=Myoviridae sp. cteo515 TaxID=2823550 RepID=A0A8S5LBH0_9CAUD|nr:MAG TPA: hypothetical protein [Myoviridae sp. cteo515]DAD67274.1 MAG TPA: hypothetical protein [Myoviridae sp. cteo515]